MSLLWVQALFTSPSDPRICCISLRAFCDILDTSDLPDAHIIRTARVKFCSRSATISCMSSLEPLVYDYSQQWRHDIPRYNPTMKGLHPTFDFSLYQSLRPTFKPLSPTIYQTHDSTYRAIYRDTANLFHFHFKLSLGASQEYVFRHKLCRP